MKDILGRQLKQYDIVVGMTIGRHSDGMRFGVFNGNKIHWKQYKSTIITSTMCNVYLVENPNEQEMEIRDEILRIHKKEKEEYERRISKRKSLKRIPTKDLVIGKTYVDDRGYKYVYLGKGTTENKKNNEIKYGYIYIDAEWMQYNKETDCFSNMPSIDVLKNPRKLVSEVDNICDYDFTKSKFTIQQYLSSGRPLSWQQKIDITLDSYREEE